MLEMKDRSSERCSIALEAEGNAMICSSSARSAGLCASEMSHSLPKCGGVRLHVRRARGPALQRRTPPEVRPGPPVAGCQPSVETLLRAAPLLADFRAR